MRDLEIVIIDFLKDYGVCGEFHSGRRGVWVERKKIASIGIAASGWVTYHGLSVNINVDPEYFKMINPCGMKDIEMVSLNSILNRNVSMADAKKRFIFKFQRMFSIGEPALGRCPAAMA
jgi:lipoyl(octanoyl) transferase